MSRSGMIPGAVNKILLMIRQALIGVTVVGRKREVIKCRSNFETIKQTKTFGKCKYIVLWHKKSYTVNVLPRYPSSFTLSQVLQRYGTKREPSLLVSCFIQSCVQLPEQLAPRVPECSHSVCQIIEMLTKSTDFTSVMKNAGYPWDKKALWKNNLQCAHVIKNILYYVSLFHWNKEKEWAKCFLV